MKAGNLVTDFTDHLSNFLLIVATNVIKSAKRPFIRIISPTNIAKFKTDLQNFDWENSICTIDDTNEAYNKTLTIINKYFEERFPLVRLSRRASKDKKWMTHGLKKCSNKKHKLYLKWISTKSFTDETIYKRYKNLYEQIVKKSENDHYKLLFDSNVNDIKTL